MAVISCSLSLSRMELGCLFWKAWHNARHLQSVALYYAWLRCNQLLVTIEQDDCFAINWLVIDFLTLNKPTDSFIFLLSLEWSVPQRSVPFPVFRFPSRPSWDWFLNHHFLRASRATCCGKSHSFQSSSRPTKSPLIRTNLLINILLNHDDLH